MSREAFKEWLAVLCAVLWLQVIGLCVYITDSQDNWLDWSAGMVMVLLSLYCEWMFIKDAGVDRLRREAKARTRRERANYYR